MKSLGSFRTVSAKRFSKTEAFNTSTVIIEGSAPAGGRSNIEVLYKRVSYPIAPGPLVPYPKKGRRDEVAGDETYYKGCNWGGTCGSGTVKVMLQLQSYGYEVAEKLASVVETQYP